MSDYSNTFGGAAKDAANSTILGADHDTEYDSIATMSATKANKTGAPATTNNLAMLTATGDLADSLVETDGSGNITANVTGDITSTGTSSIDDLTVTTTLSIPAGSISTTEIAANTITASNIAANTITASEIAANAVGQSELASGAVSRTHLDSLTSTSTAGTIGTEGHVNITLSPYSFFPMIHCTTAGSGYGRLEAHPTDGASADAPRFSIYNTSNTNSNTYDVDYRYVAA